MKTTFAIAVLVAFVAVAQSGVINEPLDDPVEYSLIDPIIKAILEKLKPKVANLKINDINETVRNPSLNATIIVKNILIKNLDSFVTQNLKSSLVPLKLTNLTLTWDEITASAGYDVDVSLGIPKLEAPIKAFAKGEAKATLSKLFFTIGANMELKNKTIQVKPKGFFGFDFSIAKANVTLSSVMGNPDLGKAIGTFVSSIIPELVKTLKNPLFDALHDDLVRIVNGVLKTNGTTTYLLDEQPSAPGFALNTLDLSGELDSFFRNAFDFELDDTKIEA